MRNFSMPSVREIRSNFITSLPCEEFKCCFDFDFFKKENIVMIIRIVFVKKYGMNTIFGRSMSVKSLLIINQLI